MTSKFIIQTNPAEAHLHGSNTMYWCGDHGIRGPIDTDHLIVRFDTREAAQAGLEALNPRTVSFYGLAVVEERPRARYVPFGTQGWMKGHPGYDLMM